MTDETVVSPYEGKLHPTTKIIVLTLLLGPVVGAILFAGNLRAMGKKHSNLVTAVAWVLFVVELALTLRYHFSDTAFLWAAVGLVYIAVVMTFTMNKEEQKSMSTLKKYAPALKPVLYGIGLEIIAAFIAVLFK